MPVTVVVGGQCGSEGKGKVCQILANHMNATAVVRIGGPNSGHTGISRDGSEVILRQLPTASLLPDAQMAIGAGSYVDPRLLLRELELTRLESDRLWIDPNAVVIEPSDRRAEADRNLIERIGSTGSGTGAAVRRRIERGARVVLAKCHPDLTRFVQPVAPALRGLLTRGGRIIIEGTQGYGLSVLHSRDYPFATSRDTTAGGFVAEAGLSPLDVDDVVLVLRAFPIRVAGNSGPLLNEIDWKTVSSQSGAMEPLIEFSSVTKRVRRVGRFDSSMVIDAITVNRPTRIVLNHLDYVDALARSSLTPTNRIQAVVKMIERQIDRKIDFYGFSPSMLYSPRGDIPLDCDSSLEQSNERQVCRV